MPLVSSDERVIGILVSEVLADSVYQPEADEVHVLSTKYPVIGELPVSSTFVEKGFHCTVTRNLVEDAIVKPETGAIGAEIRFTRDISSNGFDTV